MHLMQSKPVKSCRRVGRSAPIRRLTVVTWISGDIYDWRVLRSNYKPNIVKLGHYCPYNSRGAKGTLLQMALLSQIACGPVLLNWYCRADIRTPRPRAWNSKMKRLECWQRWDLWNYQGASTIVQQRIVVPRDGELRWSSTYSIYGSQVMIGLRANHTLRFCHVKPQSLHHIWLLIRVIIPYKGTNMSSMSRAD